MFTLFGRSKLLLLLYNKSCFVVKIKKSVEVNKKQNLVELVIVHHSFSPVRVVRLANQPCECVQEVQQQQTTVCSYLFHNHYHIFSRCRDHSVSPRGEAHCQLRNYAVEPPK